MSIGDALTIANNTLLSNCTIDAVCDFLAGPGSRFIGGNTGCCFNESILTDACNRASSGTQEICDGIDNNCDGQIDEGFDLDGDGYSTCEGDCDDTNASVNPGAQEICDGQDNNCDGNIDEGFDLDGDGVTTCDGDCDDNDPNNYPGNAEVCDGQDNNCDGNIDEGFDLDGDGVPDCFDNCPAAPNPDQTDSDCDGVGDTCDQWHGCDDLLDSDNDGTPDCVDLDELANWACGNKGTKVNICHIPPGNPANANTLCISPNAVNSHLNNHGDYICECYQITCEGSNLVAPAGNSLIGLSTTRASSDVILYPNPSRGVFTVGLQHLLGQKVSIAVNDHLGRRILYLSEEELLNSNVPIDLTDLHLPGGVYFLSVQSEKGRTVKQFVITK